MEKKKGACGEGGREGRMKAYAGTEEPAAGGHLGDLQIASRSFQ